MTVKKGLRSRPLRPHNARLRGRCAFSRQSSGASCERIFGCRSTS